MLTRCDPRVRQVRFHLYIDGAAEKEEPCYDTDRGGPAAWRLYC